ncbi:MAG: GNAT family N-acetyltransferase [Bdellovibrionales bacterium]
MPTITEYTPQDQDGVWALHMRTITENAGFVKNVSFHSDMKNIPKVYTAFFVIRDQQTIAGMVGLKQLSGNELEIKRLQVHPRYQGRGYGKALLEKVFDYAGQHNITCLRLDVSEPQTAALGLYKAMGFTVTKIERLAYGPDKEVFVSTFMEKRLS